MMGNKSFVFKFGDIEVREREFSLVKAGEILPVEPKAFRVLIVLLRNPRKLIKKEELLNTIWGDAAVTDNSLARSVALLRRLLGDEARDPRYIETVATVGYRFVCPVEASEDDSVGLDGAPAPGALAGKEPLPAPAKIIDALDAATVPAQIAHAAAPGSGSRGNVSRVKRGGWLLAIASLLVVGLAAAAWDLHRPLPAPHVIGYTPITNDGRHKELAGTDGSRIYFNWDSGANPIAEVSISGGKIETIPVALPLPVLFDVAPDGSDLLLTSSDGDQESLWTVHVPGGSMRQLQGGLAVNLAAWSPDDKSVLYRSRNGDLTMLGFDGTGPRKIAAVGNLTSSPVMSPDGSKIRFSRDDRLWEMARDGSQIHQLLPGWHTSSSQCCGRWTADGNFFIFLERNGLFNDTLGGSQIWILDERHGLLRGSPVPPAQLTSGPIRWNTLLPSKDGTKVFADGAILRGELTRYNAKTKQLQPWLAGTSAEFVTFSADGRFMAYVTFPEGILWKANRDGSSPVQLTQPPIYPVNPRWSPDGTRILFSQFDLNQREQTYIMSAQGGQPGLLLSEDRGSQTDPNWSPDGRKIGFSSLASFGEIGASNTILRIYDIENHQVTTLPGSNGVWSPRWSPNGRFIAGLYHGPSGGMKIFDFETRQWTALRQKGENDFPVWSSNSEFLYFLRRRESPGVFRIRVSTGAEERVIDLKDFRFTGTFGFWMGLDPEDTPILLRDAGTDDIYALTLKDPQTK
jgi:Tol biopolymer transport system component/DNA-binding winged helix-turn-helix (wHTH) protein